MTSPQEAAELAERLRASVRAEMPGNEYVYEYHLSWKAAALIESLTKERDQAREALVEAEPYVETLHSLVAANPARAQVYGVLKRMRAVIAACQGGAR